MTMINNDRANFEKKGQNEKNISMEKVWTSYEN